MVRFRKYLLFILALMAMGASGFSKGLGGNGRIDGKVKFMPLPYLNYDRSMGFTAGAVPMLMFNPSEKDTISPSSLIGGVATYATSKTWFLMGCGMFYLKEDRWRLTTAAGTGTVFFQFYLDNPAIGWIPYQSDATFAMVKMERRIYDKLYGGLTYMYAEVITSTENWPIADTMTLHGIGLNLSQDKRSLFPDRGSILNIFTN